jgi:TPR repeat protein
MQKILWKQCRVAGVCVALLVSALPARAGLFDDLLEKGAELVKGVGSVLNQGPSEETLLAQTPEQQDQSFMALQEEKEFDKLVKLATALHAKGSAVGTHFLGRAYLDGKGIAQDKDKGYSMIKQAAQMGDMRAQTTLAVLFFQGKKDVMPDSALGMQYLTASAEKYDGSAELLAQVYAEGKNGIPKDRAKALDVYKNHKWTNSTRWQAKIKQLEAQLQAIPTVPDFLAQTPQQQDTSLANLLAQNDYAIVMELASAAADTGSPTGKLYQAMAYLSGNGAVVNKPKGLALLTQAADAGAARAQLQLGRLLITDQDTSVRNVPVGMAYLGRCVLEFGEAAMLLAAIHEKGEHGQPVDKAKALSVYQLVREPQYASQAKTRIAALEYELKPVPTVDDLLAMPTDKQYKELSELRSKKKYAEVLSLAQALHEKGAFPGTFFVGSAHWFGRGTVVNEPLGAEYLAKAADGGIHAAEMNAGRGFLFGKWGFALDEARGLKYLQACYKYFNDCAYDIARAHENGMGGLPKDKAKALAIYRNYGWASDFENNAIIAKKIKELDPKPPHEDVFIKVMEAAKSVGVRVSNVGTSGNGYFGSGVLMVNGSIKVEFETGLEIYDGMKPKLWMTFASSDRRVHDPLRKRMIAALRGQFGSFDSTFDRNSTVFNPDWVNL